MAANVEWRVESAVWDTATGGITTVHWRASVVDGEVSADAYGSLGFTPDPEAVGFIPLAELTPADVLAWVKAREEVAGLEEDLLRQVEKKKNPTQESGLPWVVV